MASNRKLSTNSLDYGSFSSADSNRHINELLNLDTAKSTEIEDLDSTSTSENEDVSKPRAMSYGLNSTESTLVHSIRNIGMSISSSLRYSADAILQQQLTLTMTTLSFPDVPSSDRKASTFMTSMNILCLIQGVSTLAIPFVAAQGGLPVLISIFFLGISNWYGIFLIAECQHQLSKSRPGQIKRVFATYLDIGAAVFPKYGRNIMAFVNLSTALTSVSFFILIGQVTYDLFQKVVPKFSLTPQILIVSWACLVLPFLFVRRVSVIAKFSCLALFSMTSALVLCYAVLISNYAQWDLSRLKFAFNIEHVLLGCGVINNSFFAHFIAPAIEGSMRNPRKFCGASARSYSVNTVFKIGFGLLGVLTFGPMVQQSITSNLTSSMPILVSLSCLIAANLFFSFPISLCVVFDMLDEYLLPVLPVFQGHKKRRWAWLLISRLLLLLSVILVAVSVPHFGLVVSLVGNVRGTVVALVLPLHFYLKLKWKNIRIYSKVLHVFLLIFYAVIGVAGAYFSLKAIKNKV